MISRKTGNYEKKKKLSAADDGRLIMDDRARAFDIQVTTTGRWQQGNALRFPAKFERAMSGGHYYNILAAVGCAVTHAIHTICLPPKNALVFFAFRR